MACSACGHGIANIAPHPEQSCSSLDLYSQRSHLFEQRPPLSGRNKYPVTFGDEARALVEKPSRVTGGEGARGLLMLLNCEIGLKDDFMALQGFRLCQPKPFRFQVRRLVDQDAHARCIAVITAQDDAKQSQPMLEDAPAEVRLDPVVRQMSCTGPIEIHRLK
jgi:hypothetical protein